MELFCFSLTETIEPDYKNFLKIANKNNDLEDQDNLLIKKFQEKRKLVQISLNASPKKIIAVLDSFNGINLIY
jgi:hypothetical protein